jgi:ankyrin repeat protein
MKHLLLTTIAAVVLVGCSKPPPPNISIHIAAIKGNVEAVKQHLSAGTDVNTKNKEGATPLHRAAYNGHIEIAELLISKGADVNAKDNAGGTPLHEAAIEGHKEMAALLIYKSAGVNAKYTFSSYKGMTPLDFAIGVKQAETADFLRKHGGKTGEELKAEGK